MFNFLMSERQKRKLPK